MSKQSLVAIVSLILSGFLAGISVYQQYTIVSLNTQNTDLSLSLSLKTQENDILTGEYNRLNSTYSQLLSSLQTVTISMNSSLQTMTALLNSSETELLMLHEDYQELIDSCDNLSDYYIGLSANLSEKIDALETSIAWLSQEYGGYDGIFLLNHSYSFGTVGMITTYTVTMELYNALEEANVTVKVYGEGSKTFTYQMTSYEKRKYVEVWSGGAFYQDFSLIMIESVERE